MKISMMSYTMGRGEWGKTKDVVALCTFTRELGLEAIDWVTTHDHDPREIRRITDDFGLPAICYTFSARIQSPDAATRQAALDQVRKGLDTAGVLGADKIMIVVSGLPDVPRERARGRALEGLAGAVEMGSAAGIAVTIEHFPGVNSPFATSADMNDAIQAVPGLKITYDNGNALTSGEDPADAFRNSRDHIVHAHFKDWVPSDEGLLGLDGRHYRGALVGEGIVDPVPCLQAMHEAGYQGYINFEYEGSEYDAAEAMRKGVPSLQALIAEVQT